MCDVGGGVLVVLWCGIAVRRGFLEIQWNWLYIPVLGLAGFALAQALLGLSVSPYATKMELLRGGAYIILCFLAVKSFATGQELKAFACFLVTFDLMSSFFVIRKYSTSNGKLYCFVLLS